MDKTAHIHSVSTPTTLSNVSERETSMDDKSVIRIVSIAHTAMIKSFICIYFEFSGAGGLEPPFSGLLAGRSSH